jgi:hypothetical protein
MKKIYAAFLLTLTLSSYCYSELLVSRINGKVELFKRGAAASVQLKVGQLVDGGDSIKTLENGRVQLIFEDGSAVWLKENTEIKINSLLYNGREINMSRGKLRTRVTPLKLGAKFTLKTPTAVVAVRGTEFIMLVTETDSSLLVLSGKIEMGSLIQAAGITQLPPPAVISEGQKSAVTAAGVMTTPQDFTQEDISVIKDESWQKFEETAPEKTAEPEKKTELMKEEKKEQLANLKNELQEFIHDTKRENAVIENIVREVRQSDFSTARTLRDINGNVVRVEQDLLRPDPKTVEFLSLTQRDSYSYTKGKFDYTGPSGKRVDYIDQKIVFNKALPDQINEWPSYIQSLPEDSLYPTELSIEIANRTDARNHYIKLFGSRATKADDLDPNLYISPNGISQYRLFEPTSEERTAYNLDTISKNGDEVLWGIAETPFYLGDTDGKKTTNIVWMKNESYGIDNNGNILDFNYFLNAQGKSPFTVLKEIAAETIITVKKDSRTGADYFGNNGLAPSNLDLVWTPDLIITIAQKLSTQLSNISTSSDQPTN